MPPKDRAIGRPGAQRLGSEPFFSLRCPAPVPHCPLNLTMREPESPRALQFVQFYSGICIFRLCRKSLSDSDSGRTWRRNAFRISFRAQPAAVNVLLPTGKKALKNCSRLPTAKLGAKENIESDNEFQFSIFAVSLSPIAAGLDVPRKPRLETRGGRIGCRNHWTRECAIDLGFLLR